MKYLLIITDGLADRPVPELGGKTPLQCARIPNLKRLAKSGIVGTVKNVPQKFEPGSDVAILSVLGYNPVMYYNGRGPLEAASLGIPLGEKETAFRCNLVTVKNRVMVDYSAGHITSAEAKALIKLVDEKLGGKDTKFHPGTGYRHLMISSKFSPEMKCTPPHDIIGKNIDEYLPKGKGEKVIRQLMEDSALMLEFHEVNRERRMSGKNPASMIWVWGAGKTMKLPKFSEKYNVKGGVISAVDLVKGIAVSAGLEVLEVPGITGYIDTNYANKADYALKFLKKNGNDFCMIHVEATDETGHNGDAPGKVKALEDIDSKIIGPLVSGMESAGEDYRMLVCSDHPTPLQVRTHTSDPVPWLIYSSAEKKENTVIFDEAGAAAGENVALGYTLIEKLFQENKPRV
ncbi:MAG: cofactor-independent phosphoglycerate mutase [Candidatus Firestonebacteria bacterium]